MRPSLIFETFPLTFPPIRRVIGTANPNSLLRLLVVDSTLVRRMIAAVAEIHQQLVIPSDLTLQVTKADFSSLTHMPLAAAIADCGNHATVMPEIATLLRDVDRYTQIQKIVTDKNTNRMEWYTRADVCSTSDSW